jgi:hypothetical protein
MIEFVRPTVEMVESIAADMRQADANEVWASNHHTPLESMMKGWEASDFSTVAMCDGEPLVMIGLVKRDVLSGSGVVWMLGANRAMKYKKEFFRQTKPVIDEMLTICPRLCNMVHGKNTSSVQWLKWLGFTIDDPIPYGPDGELFHRFYLERSR